MHTNGETLEEACIVSDRGGIIENTHRIHAAVVDSTGRLLYSIGNPNRITLLRSAAKPAQALAIAETGALEKFAYDDSDLALICASHNSEDRHLARARGMLKKLQASEDDLRCGGHPSISPEVNRAWVKADWQPTGIHNNCSGKHVGMLAGAEAIGAGVQNYHQLEHPMQQRVKHVVEDLSQADEVISRRDKLG
jgi:L-asparaginase II